MAFLEWTDAHKGYVAEIDAQHEHLFVILNQLHAATMQGAERSTLGGIFDELIEYTVEHFNTEERLFIAHTYPGYDEHKLEHDRLTGQAVELQNQFREGSATISFEVLDFLHDWLVQHTLGTDKAASKYLHEKGCR